MFDTMNNLLLYAVVMLLCLTSCKSSAVFTPIASHNPWEDNYYGKSKMENYLQWGTYNVHDPACTKVGEYYYMYSTDAIFGEDKKRAKEHNVPLGYLQMRRSKDLVNWEFLGWAFPSIPQEAVDWVHSNANGKGASNIWAPYMIPYKKGYRLYYCVSAFGRKDSYIGLAESTSPQGPWIQKGCVVKTNSASAMNAIDPSVIVDPNSGKWWMHYGSFFGGLYCTQLNPETGLPISEGDQGHVVARRGHYTKDNLEAPEIIYNPELKKFFLFVSYDPLMTTYNVRVGRSDTPEGPFLDFNGHNLKDTINHFPILTAPYRFDNHTGWAGTAHCGVLRQADGRYFMFHQARLSPQNQLMVLHTRELYFTPEGWPVASPQRYAGNKQQQFSKADLVGAWEMIRVLEPLYERKLEAGQILWGEGELKKEECNTSTCLILSKGGNIGEGVGKWHFSDNNQLLRLSLGEEIIQHLIIFAGHDWENQTATILFAGLDSRGRSVWGKRVK